MYIGKRYLGGVPVEASFLAEQPIRSGKIEDIVRRVRRRAGQ